MALQSPYLQKCVQEAVAQAPALVELCVDAAVQALQAAGEQTREPTQRERLTQAWRGLLDHKASWSRDYARLLKTALLAPSAGSESPKSTSGFMKLDALSLVDDDKVAGSIETSRMLQVVAPAVEQELSQLDALMSTAAGLDTIQTDANPLRPDAFAQALRDMMAASEPDADLRGLWVRALGKPLGAELKAMYGRISEQLKRANVQEAAYRVRLVAGAPGAARAPQASPSGFAPLPGEPQAGGPRGGAGVPSGFGGLPSMPSLARARSAVAHQVFHDFLERGGTQFDQLLAPAYYSAVDEELAALELAAAQPVPDLEAVLRARTQYRDVPAVDRPAREVDIGAQLSSEEWGEYATAHARARELMALKKKAVRVAQAVGLDVVRTLVNQVAQDPRLLAPVREAVVVLEPALLRLAMANPRYFREGDHPARRLVESVAQRSFRYNDEFAPEFTGFFRPVQEEFNDLNATPTEDPQAFANALARLQRGWDEQDQHELEARDKGLQSMRFAEERQALADQIAWDLSQRSDLVDAPAMILDFIYGPWSLVIAHAQLMGKPGQLDPGGYRRAVADLLWSVKKEVTLKEPGKLFGVVPGLLQTLNAGLDLLGQPREESRPFFDALMRLHNPVLKLRRKVRASQDSGLAPLTGAAPLDSTSMSMEIDETLAPTPEQLKPRKAAQPWLGRHELDEAGFSDTLPAFVDEMEDVPGEAHAAPEMAQQAQSAARARAAAATDTYDDEPEGGHHGDDSVDAGAVLASLQTGDWVDLFHRRHWLRAQLTWASNKGTLFMFTSRGGRPHSMTKRICERLIRDRMLRPVDTHAVVDKALQAIADRKTEEQALAA